MQKSLPSFEILLNMAKSDPDALELLRTEMVRDAINGAAESNRQRLRGLQFQIDGQRLRSKTPMQACMDISRMMHDSLLDLKAYIDDTTGQGTSPMVAAPAEPAKVLRFPSSVV